MDTAPQSRSRLRAAGVSFLAVLPLLIVQLLLVTDPNGWLIAADYGVRALIQVVFVIGFFAFVAAESHLRTKYLAGIQRLPWFTPVAAVGMISFFLVGEWAKPLVMRRPELCRVNQVVRWGSAANHGFVLVLVGRGNAADHEFVSARLKWLGPDPAGIMTVDFNPMAFSWWGGTEQVVVKASPRVLRDRLSPPGYSSLYLDYAASSIWDVLQQANEGQTVSSRTGRVEAVWEAPFGAAHVAVGGILWMIVLSLLFLVVGQVTLCPARRPET